MPSAERYWPSSSAPPSGTATSPLASESSASTLVKASVGTVCGATSNSVSSKGVRPGTRSRCSSRIDPGADQRIELVAGGAVAHQAVRVDLDRRVGEQLGERQRRVDLDGLHDQLDAVIAQAPQQPQMPLPQRGVVRARRPAARMERADRLVPRQHPVEAAAQPLEAGHGVQGRGGLRGRRVVADQQQLAARPGRSSRRPAQRRGSPRRRAWTP